MLEFVARVLLLRPEIRSAEGVRFCHAAGLSLPGRGTGGVQQVGEALAAMPSARAGPRSTR